MPTLSKSHRDFLSSLAEAGPEGRRIHSENPYFLASDCHPSEFVDWLRLLYDEGLVESVPGKEQTPGWFRLTEKGRMFLSV